MANDYIVRLQGQDNLSGTIRNVQRRIQELSGSANRLDQIEQKFNRIDQSSAPLRKKLKDVKYQMEQLAIAGETSSELYNKMADAAKRYQAALDQVNASTRTVTASTNQMNSEGGFSLGSIDLKGAASDIASKAGLGNIGGLLGAIASPAGAATAAIAGVGAVMVSAAKQASEFETALTSMGALTGLSGKDLEDLGQGARNLAKEYGSSASEVLASMELIGSQAPELLKNKDALIDVTDAANVLAKAGGMSVEEAAKAITTTMNQMGVSADEAMSIVNTLGAGSQQGAAGIEYLNKAFEKSGTQAKAAGMSYGDLTAAIETVAPKFSSADVAGSQLNSTLLVLSMASSEYNPQVVGMSQALENLSKAELDNAKMKELVGASNVTMLSSLIEGREQFDSYRESLVGTTTAQDQAAQKMGTFEEKINRLKSAWDDTLITLGQSQPIQDIMDLIIALGEGLMDVFDALVDVWDAFTDVGDEGVTQVNLLIGVWDALVAIIKGVVTVVEIVIRAINKLRDMFIKAVKEGCIDTWNKFKDSMSNVVWVQKILNAFKKIGDYFKSICDYILKLWNKMCDTLGMEDKKVNIGGTPSAPSDDAGGNNTSTTETTVGSSGGGKGKGSKSSSTKTEKIDYIVSVDDNTLDTAEKKLSAWTSKQKTIKIDDVEGIAECDANIKKWTDEVKKRKIALGITPEVEDKPILEDGSINKMKQQIKEKEKELQLALNTNLDGVSVRKIIDKLDALRKQEESKEIELGIKSVPSIQKEDNKRIEKGSIEDKKQSLSNANSMIDDIKQNYKLKLIGADEARTQIDAINAQLQELGLKPIELTVNDNGTITTAIEDLEAYKKQMSQVSSITSSMGNVFGSLGQAIGGTGGKMVEMAGQSMQAVAQIIPQIVALVGAKEAEALAGGTASAAALPFPANIAAIASIVATITGLFASFAGSFADGGIIQGGTFHGDNILARVNAGEMILNQKQQGNLFRALDSGGATGGGIRNVEFKISGSSLKGCLKNYDSKIDKIK